MLWRQKQHERHYFFMCLLSDYFFLQVLTYLSNWHTFALLHFVGIATAFATIRDQDPKTFQPANKALDCQYWATHRVCHLCSQHITTYVDIHFQLCSLAIIFASSCLLGICPGCLWGIRSLEAGSEYTVGFVPTFPFLYVSFSSLLHFSKERL